MAEGKKHTQQVTYKKESHAGMTTLTYRTKRYTFPSVPARGNLQSDGLCVMLDMGLFCPFCTGGFSARFTSTHNRIAGPHPHPHPQPGQGELAAPQAAGALVPRKPGGDVQRHLDDYYHEVEASVSLKGVPRRGQQLTVRDTKVFQKDSVRTQQRVLTAKPITKKVPPPVPPRKALTPGASPVRPTSQREGSITPRSGASSTASSGLPSFTGDARMGTPRSVPSSTPSPGLPAGLGQSRIRRIKKTPPPIPPRKRPPSNEKGPSVHAEGGTGDVQYGDEAVRKKFCRERETQGERLDIDWANKRATTIPVCQPGEGAGTASSPHTQQHPIQLHGFTNYYVTGRPSSLRGRAPIRRRPLTRYDLNLSPRVSRRKHVSGDQENDTRSPTVCDKYLYPMRPKSVSPKNLSRGRLPPESPSLNETPPFKRRPLTKYDLNMPEIPPYRKRSGSRGKNEDTPSKHGDVPSSNLEDELVRSLAHEQSTYPPATSQNIHLGGEDQFRNQSASHPYYFPDQAGSDKLQDVYGRDVPALSTYSQSLYTTPTSQVHSRDSEQSALPHARGSDTDPSLRDDDLERLIAEGMTSQHRPQTIDNSRLVGGGRSSDEFDSAVSSSNRRGPIDYYGIGGRVIKHKKHDKNKKVGESQYAVTGIPGVRLETEVFQTQSLPHTVGETRFHRDQVHAFTTSITQPGSSSTVDSIGDMGRISSIRVAETKTKKTVYQDTSKQENIETLCHKREKSVNVTSVGTSQKETVLSSTEQISMSQTEVKPKSPTPDVGIDELVDELHTLESTLTDISKEPSQPKPVNIIRRTIIKHNIISDQQPSASNLSPNWKPTDTAFNHSTTHKSQSYEDNLDQDIELYHSADDRLSDECTGSRDTLDELVDAAEGEYPGVSRDRTPVPPGYEEVSHDIIPVPPDYASVSPSSPNIDFMIGGDDREEDESEDARSDSSSSSSSDDELSRLDDDDDDFEEDVDEILENADTTRYSHDTTLRKIFTQPRRRKRKKGMVVLLETERETSPDKIFEKIIDAVSNGDGEVSKFLSEKELVRNIPESHQETEPANKKRVFQSPHAMVPKATSSRSTSVECIADDASSTEMDRTTTPYEETKSDFSTDIMDTASSDFIASSNYAGASESSLDRFMGETSLLTEQILASYSTDIENNELRDRRVVPFPYGAPEQYDNVIEVNSTEPEQYDNVAQAYAADENEHYDNVIDVDRSGGSTPHPMLEYSTGLSESEAEIVLDDADEDLDDIRSRNYDAIRSLPVSDGSPRVRSAPQTLNRRLRIWGEFNADSDDVVGDSLPFPNKDGARSRGSWPNPVILQKLLSPLEKNQVYDVKRTYTPDNLTYRTSFFSSSSEIQRRTRSNPHTPEPVSVSHKELMNSEVSLQFGPIKEDFDNRPRLAPLNLGDTKIMDRESTPPREDFTVESSIHELHRPPIKEDGKDMDRSSKIFQGEVLTLSREYTLCTDQLSDTNEIKAIQRTRDEVDDKVTDQYNTDFERRPSVLHASLTDESETEYANLRRSEERTIPGIDEEDSSASDYEGQPPSDLLNKSDYDNNMDDMMLRRVTEQMTYSCEGTENAEHEFEAKPEYAILRRSEERTIPGLQESDTSGSEYDEPICETTHFYLDEHVPPNEVNECSQQVPESYPAYENLQTQGIERPQHPQFVYLRDHEHEGSPALVAEILSESDGEFAADERHEVPDSVEIPQQQASDNEDLYVKHSVKNLIEQFNADLERKPSVVTAKVPLDIRTSYSPRLHRKELSKPVDIDITESHLENNQASDHDEENEEPAQRDKDMVSTDVLQSEHHVITTPMESADAYRPSSYVDQMDASYERKPSVLCATMGILNVTSYSPTIRRKEMHQTPESPDVEASHTDIQHEESVSLEKSNAESANKVDDKVASEQPPEAPLSDYEICDDLEDEIVDIINELRRDAEEQELLDQLDKSSDQSRYEPKPTKMDGDTIMDYETEETLKQIDRRIDDTLNQQIEEGFTIDQSEECTTSYEPCKDQIDEAFERKPSLLATPFPLESKVHYSPRLMRKELSIPENTDGRLSYNESLCASETMFHSNQNYHLTNDVIDSAQKDTSPSNLSALAEAALPEQSKYLQAASCESGAHVGLADSSPVILERASPGPLGQAASKERLTQQAYPEAGHSPQATTLLQQTGSTADKHAPEIVTIQSQPSDHSTLITTEETLCTEHPVPSILQGDSVDTTQLPICDITMSSEGKSSVAQTSICTETQMDFAKGKSSEDPGESKERRSSVAAGSICMETQFDVAKQQGAKIESENEKNIAKSEEGERRTSVATESVCDETQLDFAKSKAAKDAVNTERRASVATETVCAETQFDLANVEKEKGQEETGGEAHSRERRSSAATATICMETQLDFAKMDITKGQQTEVSSDEQNTLARSHVDDKSGESRIPLVETARTTGESEVYTMATEVEMGSLQSVSDLGYKDQLDRHFERRPSAAVTCICNEALFDIAYVEQSPEILSKLVEDDEPIEQELEDTPARRGSLANVQICDDTDYHRATTIDLQYQPKLKETMTYNNSNKDVIAQAKVTDTERISTERRADVEISSAEPGSVSQILTREALQERAYSYESIHEPELKDQYNLYSERRPSAAASGICLETQMNIAKYEPSPEILCTISETEPTVNESVAVIESPTDRRSSAVDILTCEDDEFSKATMNIQAQKTDIRHEKEMQVERVDVVCRENSVSPVTDNITEVKAAASESVTNKVEVTETRILMKQNSTLDIDNCLIPFDQTQTSDESELDEIRIKETDKDDQITHLPSVVVGEGQTDEHPEVDISDMNVFDLLTQVHSHYERRTSAASATPCMDAAESQSETETEPDQINDDSNAPRRASVTTPIYDTNAPFQKVEMVDDGQAVPNARRSSVATEEMCSEMQFDIVTVNSPLMKPSGSDRWPSFISVDVPLDKTIHAEQSTEQCKVASQPTEPEEEFVDIEGIKRALVDAYADAELSERRTSVLHDVRRTSIAEVEICTETQYDIARYDTYTDAALSERRLSVLQSSADQDNTNSKPQATRRASVAEETECSSIIYDLAFSESEVFPESDESPEERIRPKRRRSSVATSFDTINEKSEHPCDASDEKDPETQLKHVRRSSVATEMKILETELNLCEKTHVDVYDDAALSQRRPSVLPSTLDVETSFVSQSIAGPHEYEWVPHATEEVYDDADLSGRRSSLLPRMSRRRSSVATEQICEETTHDMAEKSISKDDDGLASKVPPMQGRRSSVATEEVCMEVQFDLASEQTDPYADAATSGRRPSLLPFKSERRSSLASQTIYLATEFHNLSDTRDTAPDECDPTTNSQNETQKNVLDFDVSVVPFDDVEEPIHDQWDFSSVRNPSEAVPSEDMVKLMQYAQVMQSELRICHECVDGSVDSMPTVDISTVDDTCKAHSVSCDHPIQNVYPVEGEQIYTTDQMREDGKFVTNIANVTEIGDQIRSSVIRRPSLASETVLETPHGDITVTDYKPKKPLKSSKVNVYQYAHHCAHDIFASAMHEICRLYLESKRRDSCTNLSPSEVTQCVTESTLNIASYETDDPLTKAQAEAFLRHMLLGQRSGDAGDNQLSSGEDLAACLADVCHVCSDPEEEVLSEELTTHEVTIEFKWPKYMMDPPMKLYKQPFREIHVKRVTKISDFDIDSKAIEGSNGKTLYDSLKEITDSSDNGQTSCSVSYTTDSSDTGRTPCTVSYTTDRSGRTVRAETYEQKEVIEAKVIDDPEDCRKEEDLVEGCSKGSSDVESSGELERCIAHDEHLASVLPAVTHKTAMGSGVKGGRRFRYLQHARSGGKAGEGVCFSSSTDPTHVPRLLYPEPVSPRTGKARHALKSYSITHVQRRDGEKEHSVCTGHEANSAEHENVTYNFDIEQENGIYYITQHPTYRGSERDMSIAYNRNSTRSRSEGNISLSDNRGQPSEQIVSGKVNERSGGPGYITGVLAVSSSGEVAVPAGCLTVTDLADQLTMSEATTSDDDGGVDWMSGSAILHQEISSDACLEDPFITRSMPSLHLCRHTRKPTAGPILKGARDEIKMAFDQLGRRVFSDSSSSDSSSATPTEDIGEAPETGESHQYPSSSLTSDITPDDTLTSESDELARWQDVQPHEWRYPSRSSFSGIQRQHAVDLDMPDDPCGDDDALRECIKGLKVMYASSSATPSESSDTHPDYCSDATLSADLDSGGSTATEDEVFEAPGVGQQHGAASYIDSVGQMYHYDPMMANEMVEKLQEQGVVGPDNPRWYLRPMETTDAGMCEPGDSHAASGLYNYHGDLKLDENPVDALPDCGAGQIHFDSRRAPGKQHDADIEEMDHDDDPGLGDPSVHGKYRERYQQVLGETGLEKYGVAKDRKSEGRGQMSFRNQALYAKPKYDFDVDPLYSGLPDVVPGDLEVHQFPHKPSPWISRSHDGDDLDSEPRSAARQRLRSRRENALRSRRQARAARSCSTSSSERSPIAMRKWSSHTSAIGHTRLARGHSGGDIHPDTGVDVYSAYQDDVLERCASSPVLSPTAKRKCNKRPICVAQANIRAYLISKSTPMLSPRSQRRAYAIDPRVAMSVGHVGENLERRHAPQELPPARGPPTCKESRAANQASSALQAKPEDRATVKQTPKNPRTHMSGAAHCPSTADGSSYITPTHSCSRTPPVPRRPMHSKMPPDTEIS